MIHGIHPIRPRRDRHLRRQIQSIPQQPDAQLLPQRISHPPPRRQQLPGGSIQPPIPSLPNNQRPRGIAHYNPPNNEIIQIIQFPLTPIPYLSSKIPSPLGGGLGWG